MNQRKQALLGNMQIVLGSSLFGLIPIFTQFAKNVNVVHLVFFRAFFGALFILIILLSAGGKLQKPVSGWIKMIVWSIILMIAIGSYLAALKRIPIAPAVLLLSLHAPLTIVLSRLLLKEKIYKYTYLALILTMVGMVIIISPKGFTMPGTLGGYLLAINAALFTALNFVFPKKYLAREDPYIQTFYQTLFQFLFILPFIFSWPIILLPQAILVYAGLGLFCSALAFLLIYKGLKKTKTQYAGILQSMESIVPIILGILLFQQIPSSETILGGVMIMAGFFFILWKDFKNE